MGDDKVGDMFADRVGELFDVEAERGHVVRVAESQLGAVSFSEVDVALDRVRHVHHRERGSFLDETLVFFVLDRFVVDRDRVICGSAAGRGLVGDQPGEAHAADVDLPLVPVVVAEEFAGDFRDAVDCGRAEDCLLGGVVERGAGTEHGDRARDNHADKFVIARDVEHIFETVHVDLPRASGVFLADSGKDCREMVDRVDVVFLDQRLDAFLVNSVREFKRSGFQEFLAGWGFTSDRDHVLRAVFLPQGKRQLGADLSDRADDHDIFDFPVRHVWLPRHDDVMSGE